MTKIIRTAFLCLFITCIHQAFAQTKTLTGTVTDEKNAPVQGATVAVKGTSSGTSTDASGKFTLTIPASAATLTITNIGYTSQDISINGKTSLTITLTATAQNLTDVVLIGYGTARRREVTGSVATVTSKDFQRGSITTPEQLIAGKVAGVSITSNGGSPGSGSVIRIRGGASLNAIL